MAKRIGAGGNEPHNGSAKAVHVNMMTDTIIANLSPDGLRSVMRALLGADASVTSSLHSLAAQYLAGTKPSSMPVVFESSQAGAKPLPAFHETQGRYRCLMGCGYGFASMEELAAVIQQTGGLVWDGKSEESQGLLEVFESIDGDVVQVVTAVQKELLTTSGMRSMTSAEAKIMAGLRAALHSCRDKAIEKEQEFPFERGLSRLQKLEGSTSRVDPSMNSITYSYHPPSKTLETIQLGKFTVPRMFMGLWQFSSPSWGTATKSKIYRHFRKHVDAGFTAYDMADHYGDAEVTFGQFRNGQLDSGSIYCATKWAVFEPIEVTPETVNENITERLTNINAKSVELLQFHWQDYNDQKYVKASKLIQADPRVSTFGLCNFDTNRMNEILESGVPVVSNQVQFSLIDLRPTFKMAESCRKYNVKLLTYGSLCGGFLADKWLDKPSPSSFEENMTPSHRKYLEMIVVWGGWALFQELLRTLGTIGKKYDASISNVATRWVLDHDYVGAVIIGARMGISEHTEENLKVFSFRLDGDDMALIQKVLDRSKARDVFEAMGDCGAEYR